MNVHSASVCTQPEIDLLIVKEIEWIYCASMCTQTEADFLTVEAIKRYYVQACVLSTK